MLTFSFRRFFAAILIALSFSASTNVFAATSNFECGIARGTFVEGSGRVYAKNVTIDFSSGIKTYSRLFIRSGQSAGNGFTWVIFEDQMNRPVYSFMSSNDGRDCGPLPSPF